MAVRPPPPPTQTAHAFTDTANFTPLRLQGRNWQGVPRIWPEGDAIIAALPTLLTKQTARHEAARVADGSRGGTASSRGRPSGTPSSPTSPAAQRRGWGLSMTLSSTIEWTDASWNPTTGCTKVSAGCKHCYAERMAKRLQSNGQPKLPRWLCTAHAAAHAGAPAHVEKITANFCQFHERFVSPSDTT